MSCTRWAGLGAYVPERVLTNADLEQRLDTTDEWIRTRTGIERRHIAAEDETTATLATAAGRAALADAGIAPGDIGWLIVATDTPEVRTPATACFVQDALGLKAAAAVDMTGGCSGFLQGLMLADAYVRLHGTPALVIGAEVISRVVDWTDRSTCVLIGDGAAGAVLVPDSGRRRRGPRWLGGFARTDGSQTDILQLPYGGVRYPVPDEQGPPCFVMKGQTVFRWAVERMSEAGLAVLEQAGLAPGDVDLLVPHQANARIIRAVAERLGVPDERRFMDVAEYGNTGSASIGIALADARRQGLLRPGMRVLLAAFGAGFTWAGGLLEWS